MSKPAKKSQYQKNEFSDE
jgi:hypothetical protein